MTTPGRRLMNFLEEGEDNLKKGGEIAGTIGLERNDIRRIVLEENLPIGSNSKGYFVIRNEDEFKKAMMGLKHRIEGLKKRMNAISIGWEKRKTDNPLLVSKKYA